MKNKLTNLQDHIFEMIEDIKDLIGDEELTDEKLNRKIKIHMTFNEHAKIAIANGALMVKCVDILYGIPVSDDVPLVPKAKGETFLVGNTTKRLTQVPMDDPGYGFKKGKQQPI